jgi:nitroimidazol reductase NimA-like FMN-containing flavoprotein (pyridoxamine 5'-phosphate oxidase superfamily)
LKFVLADKTARPLDASEVDGLLSQSNLLRLAFVDERDLLPMVHPVWYLYRRNKFLVATDKNGVKARSFRKNPSAYFLVDVNDRSPHGVRGKGTARVVDDSIYASKVTEDCVLKYMGKLEGKAARSILEMGAGSVVIEITPRYMATWKY